MRPPSVCNPAFYHMHHYTVQLLGIWSSVHITIWQASALYWLEGPIQGCICHVTDLLDVDIGI